MYEHSRCLGGKLLHLGGLAVSFLGFTEPTLRKIKITEGDKYCYLGGGRI